MEREREREREREGEGEGKDSLVTSAHRAEDLLPFQLFTKVVSEMSEPVTTYVFFVTPFHLQSVLIFSKFCKNYVCNGMYE
jgi:hypothetical protein